MSNPDKQNSLVHNVHNDTNHNLNDSFNFTLADIYSQQLSSYKHHKVAGGFDEFYGDELERSLKSQYSRVMETMDLYNKPMAINEHNILHEKSSKRKSSYKKSKSKSCRCCIGRAECVCRKTCRSCQTCEDKCKD